MFGDVNLHVNSPPELNNEFVTVEIGIRQHIMEGIECHDMKLSTYSPFLISRNREKESKFIKGPFTLCISINAAVSPALSL